MLDFQLLLPTADYLDQACLKGHQFTLSLTEDNMQCSGHRGQGPYCIRDTV